MYNRYPESERVFGDVYKIIGGKDSEGVQEKRERSSETQESEKESEKERELLFGIRYLGIMVFVILLD